MNTIVVAYATPKRQVELVVGVDENCTVLDSIHRSGLLRAFPEIDLDSQPVGLNSRKVSLDTMVSPGQRVEVYRPLELDPNQARLLRAEKRV